MSVINTNYLSLVAQNNLQKSQSALGTAIERLSSGLRINSAKDDAAGQAIANRMSSQVNGLNQAARNANDGISVAQTTEGALNQINDNLQRIRVLTVQSANGTNSPDDLTSIQNEIGQRLEEINRISKETSFNGVKVLSTDDGLKIQVGANDSEAITIGLQQINAETLGLTGFNVDGKAEVANDAATDDDLVLAGFIKGSGNDYTKTTITNNTRATSADLVSKLDNGATVNLLSTSNTGFTSDAAGTNVTFAGAGALTYNSTTSNFTYDLAAASATSVASNLQPAAGQGARAATVTIGGAETQILIQEDGKLTNTANEQLYIDSSGNLTATTSGANSTYATATIQKLTALMGDDAGQTATTINADGGAALDLSSTDIHSAKIELANGTTFQGTDTGIDVTDAIASKTDVASMLAAAGGTVSLTGNLNVADNVDGTEAVNVFTVLPDGKLDAGETVGDVAINADIYLDSSGNLTTATTTTTTQTYYAHDNGKVTDNTGAQVFKNEAGTLTMAATSAGEKTVDPLKTLDAALKKVDALRSDLGAIQNRFISAITNLQTNVTNLSSARSRIEDADYAVEVANMSKNQILQQAGTSVLAQANQIPQGVLSLLR